MQRYLLTLILVSLSFTIGCTDASQFDEGVHYHELSTSKSEEPVITEFFSFYCGSCYQFQPFNAQVKAEWPGMLVEHHVSNLAPQGFGTTIQSAWAAARLLEVDKGFAELVFERNFEQRKQVDSMDALYEIFESLGVEPDELDRSMQSFQARTLVRRMQSEEGRYNVRGTPTYIVNGRYLMDQRAFRNSEDFFNDYLELMRYLLEK